MTLEEVSTQRVAIWGLGQEGLAMAKVLMARGALPLFVDDHPATATLRIDATIGPGHAVVQPSAVSWAGVDVVVRSPGVSRYRPELTAATASGTSITTAMALWFEDYAESRVVAVTGTKGKSTTAALAASILRHDGLDVALIGNIGVPVTAMYDRAEADAYVVEVSSYQATDVRVTPGVCVLTSLAPDHLDWHGSEEAYYRDKLRLIEAGPTGALAVSAGSREALDRTDRHPHRTLFGPEGRVRTGADGTVEIDGVTVGSTTTFRAPGRHNRWNLCGAITGALLLTGEPPSSEAVQATIDGFEGLPSRCRTLGVHGGLTFVDDALASNPFATLMSIEAFPGRELTVILGGVDRGVSPADLVDVLIRRRPVTRVIVLPPDPDRLVEALRSADHDHDHDHSTAVPIEVVSDLAAAVERAAAITPAGGVVLFSPAAPTPEGEGGYGERSRQFIAAAGILQGEQA